MFAKYLDNYEPYSPPVLQSFNRVHPVPPVTKSELVGWILDTAAQYLYNKNFPSKLITLILVQLDKWTSADISSELEFHEIGNNLYDGTKLRITVITKVDQICLNSKTSGLEEEEAEEDGSYLETSYSTIKNGRRSLEDRLTVLTRADKLFNNLPAPLSYFGIFDGHNGWDAAAFASAQLHCYLFKHFSTNNDNLVDVSEALISAFQETDREYLLKLKEQPSPSAAGTTASVGVILGAGEDRELHVAWVGDSDVVLFSEGGVAESIVRPHKPGRLDEMSRILEAGGQVLKSGHSSADTWRVSGVLAVSRAIGDVALKPWVIPDPEIFHKPLNGTEEFLILASDGLWDTVDVKRAYQIVRENLDLLDSESENYVMSSIAEKLVIEAKNSGSTDNISVIVVVLRDFKRN